MNVVDANVLLYAVNEQSDRHDEARSWLDDALSGGAVIGFAWISMLAFARLATKPNLFARPLSIDGACSRIDAWLSSPAAVVIEPVTGHASLVRSLLAGVGTAGKLVNDAHLAALSIEHRGQVVSYDSDFARFDGVRWSPPTR